MFTNSVAHPIERFRRAGADVGLTLVDEMKGYCPAASGQIEERYLLVFTKNKMAHD